MKEGNYRSGNGLTQRRGSYHRGKSACPFLRQRDTVGHWRLVNDIVKPRTWDVILKGKRRWLSSECIQSHCTFLQALHPLTLSLTIIPQDGHHCHIPADRLVHHFLPCPVTISVTKAGARIPSRVWNPLVSSHYAVLHSRGKLLFFMPIET